jgi:predicted protein tyrosine phosphatase
MSPKKEPKRARLAHSSPEIVVLSREDAERYVPESREVCISIADPQAEPARISNSFLAVLRLHFDDVIAPTDPSDIVFASEHARAIDEFVDRWPDVDRIVVHCNMGMSRSPGVALGVCDVRGWATAAIERSHPGWNRLVRKTLLDVVRSKSQGAS